MNFKKVHPDFGIEINDIKINKANKKEIDEILNLFEEYSLIVLKDQKITNEEQLDFAKNFGELEVTKRSFQAHCNSFLMLKAWPKYGA